MESLSTPTGFYSVLKPCLTFGLEFEFRLATLPTPSKYPHPSDPRPAHIISLESLAKKITQPMSLGSLGENTTPPSHGRKSTGQRGRRPSYIYRLLWKPQVYQQLATATTTPRRRMNVRCSGSSRPIRLLNCLARVKLETVGGKIVTLLLWKAGP
jgi:hypothetical protein